MSETNCTCETPVPCQEPNIATYICGRCAKPLAYVPPIKRHQLDEGRKSPYWLRSGRHG